MNAVWAVAKRPGLWPTAVRAAFSMRPDGATLPIPDKDWLAFRLETAYGGDGTGPMRADDLITWLEWQRSQA